MAIRTEKSYNEQDKIQATDHDSIIRLEGKVDQILVDIKELKNGFANKIVDLEKRVQSLEGLKTKMIGIGIAVSIAIGLFGLYIRSFIEDVFKHIYK